MSFAPAYLVYRFLYHILRFFHHWYRDGSRVLFHYFLRAFGKLEGVFALSLTARYFFHPLYQDFSIVGRIVGIFFRSGRILIGLFVYALLAVFFVLIYLAWILLIPLLVFEIFLAAYPALFAARIL
ncbi:MAG: hypothetical protein UY56_C0008G0020 [Parcubacteria group bacterium GW2011_GWA1_50_14]|nr:MAG: hypothetical protein UY56_C0008G0020 [Parcubacteria group bacterium GW2011_GWA1_50_14]